MSVPHLPPQTNTATNPPKHQTHMKDISTLISELIEALDRNTAAHRHEPINILKPLITNNPPKTAEESEAIATPVAKAKSKPAVPKVDLIEVPQEEEEATEEAPKKVNPLDTYLNATIADLKAYAGSIHDAAVRATIKAFLKEECQCENLATAKESDYPKILQALVENGATDTRVA
jgi:hypothetical protein